MGPDALRALPLLALVALSAAACMEPLDPERPISLELDSDFSSREVNTIRATARCWNMDLGTQIVLNDDAADQQVPVYPSDLACDYAGGITHYNSGIEVSICNLTRRDIGVYQVMLHELGHVLNIKEHAQGDEAVMGTGNCLSKVDRAMFFTANPGFAGQQGPDRTYRLAPDQGGFASLLKLGTAAVSLWRDRGTIAFQLIEARTARPTAVRGTLHSPMNSDLFSSLAYGEVAFAVAGGFGVLWSELGGMIRVARVRLPDGRVEPAQQIAVEGLWPVAAVAGDDALYLATQESPDLVSVSVVELIDGAWSLRSLVSLQGSLTAQALSYHGGRLFLLGLVPDTERTVRLQAISTAGVVEAARDYTSLGRWPLRPSTAAGDGALYYVNLMEDPPGGAPPQTCVHVLRVEVDGSELGNALTSQVELPETPAWRSLPSLALADGRLWLTMRAGEWGEQDVMISAQDAQTLQRREGWRRVSAPDFCGAGTPAILGLEDRLLLVWDQLIGGPKSRVVLTR